MAYQGDYQAKVNHFIGLGCQANEDECRSIYKLTEEIVHSKENIPESYVILGLEKVARISTHYRGLALFVLAEYFHKKVDPRYDVASKHAISVLRLMTELFPCEAENFYALGKLYWLDCHTISRKEALESFKKSFQLGKKESDNFIWKILLLDPKYENEKEFLYYLNKDLEKYTGQELWDERQEKDILNKICRSPSIWIYNLEPYAKRNSTLTHFLVELYIKNCSLKEASKLLEWELSNGVDVKVESWLKFSIINDYLNNFPFVYGLCKYANKIDHGNEITWLFYKYGAIPDVDWRECWSNESEVPLWLRYYNGSDLINIQIIEYCCDWMFSCSSDKLRESCFRKIRVFISSYIYENHLPIYDKLPNRFENIAGGSFKNLCEHYLMVLLDHKISPEYINDFVTYFLGNSSFSRLMTRAIELKADDLPWDYLIKVLKCFSWYKDFEIELNDNSLSELDAELIKAGSVNKCSQFYSDNRSNLSDDLRFEILKRGAINGGLYCMYELANYFYFTKSKNKSIGASIYWLCIAAANGDDNATAQLGAILQCSPINENEVGFSFIEEAYANCSRLGGYYYAKSLIKGVGCEKNLSKGIEVMKYLEDEDYPLAVEWLEQRRKEEQERLQKEKAEREAKEKAEREAKEKARIEAQKKAEAAAAAATRAQQEKLRKQALAAKKAQTDRYICLDTETTGLSDVYDRVCEIAAVEFDPVTFEILSRFRVYINPQKSMPSHAYSIHGLSDAFLRDKPVFKGVVNQFLQYIRGAHVYIHNASYDKKMLNAELQRVSLYPLERYCKGVHCTLRAAVKLRGRGGNRLDDLCDDYRINRSKRTNHGALVDCELLVEVMRALKDHGATFEGMK